MHPLFGPGADGTSQNIVLTPTTPAERRIAARLAAWLSDMGFTVSTMSPKKHDEMMSIALGLSHFVGLALGQAWAGFGFAELRNAPPTSFKRLLGLVENVAESDPEFYASLQVILPDVIKAEGRFVANAGRLLEMVRAGDEAALATALRHLGEEVRTAKR